MAHAPRTRYDAAMRRLNLLGVGALHTSLLVVLPAFHVTAWTGAALPTGSAALISLPFLALVAAAMHPARWLSLGVYPVAHLPALVAVPALTGPIVYDGPLGLAALAAVAALAAAFVALAVRPLPAPPRSPQGLRDHALPISATAVSLLIFAAFLSPIIGADSPPDPVAAQLALVVATAVAGWFGVRTARGDIADLWLDPRARETWLGVVLAERRASTPSLLLSLLAAVLLGSIIIAIYGLGT